MAITASLCPACKLIDPELHLVSDGKMTHIECTVCHGGCDCIPTGAHVVRLTCMVCGCDKFKVAFDNKDGTRSDGEAAWLTKCVVCGMEGVLDG